MTQTPDHSPRAQAILRAIENEAQARRERMERDGVPGAYTPPTAPLPPMPAPLPSSAEVLSQPAFAGPATPVEPLGEAADRLMALVDHVVAQTEGVRARVREVEQSLDLLSNKLSEPVAPTPPETLKPAFVEEPAAVAVAEPPPVEAEPPAPAVEPPAPIVESPAPVVEPPPPEPVVTEVPPPVAKPAPVTPKADESDGARLMAIEMAVSGSSRGEVGDRLTHDFGVTDPTPFLDDVFGAGSADDSRMPWTS